MQSACHVFCSFAFWLNERINIELFIVGRVGDNKKEDFGSGVFIFRWQLDPAPGKCGQEC